MGACYTVIFKLKVKDKEKAISSLHEWMNRNEAEKFCRFSLDGFKTEGVTPDTFENIMRIVLAGWKCTPYKVLGPDENGFVTFENDFTASYGWEIVLLDFVKALAPHLQDGSTMYIEPDDSCHEFMIEFGKIITPDNNDFGNS